VLIAPKTILIADDEPSDIATMQRVFQKAKIIVFTSGNNVAEIKEAYQLGAYSFLVKPLVVEDFMNLVNGLKGLRLATGDQGSYLDFDTTFIEKP
jgi:response regulator of citrate/malate metabolism